MAVIAARPSRPHIDIERTLDIVAPRERVWDVLAHVERWSEWTASVTSVEYLDGMPFVVREPSAHPAAAPAGGGLDRDRL